MSEFVPACALDDLAENEAFAVKVGDLALALVHQGDVVYAIEDACSHADVPLSEGEVSGCTLECWLHGSQFDLRDGKPLSPPAIKPVRVYETRLRETGGRMMVEVRTVPLTDAEIEARKDTSLAQTKDAS